MEPIHQEFFEAFETALRPLTTVRTSKTPTKMIIGAAESDWVYWRMIPSSASLIEVFAQYDRAAGKPLPPTFCRWYESMFTLDMDCAIVQLPTNPSNARGAGLLKYIIPGHDFWERPIALGLLPFGDEANMDAGPLCFDTRGGGDSDHWPICYWDHDWAYRPEEIGPVIFSSFDRLIAGVTAYLRHIAKGEQDHRAAVESLLAADPEGAGGPGREYWTAMMDDE